MKPLVFEDYAEFEYCVLKIIKNNLDVVVSEENDYKLIKVYLGDELISQDYL